MADNTAGTSTAREAPAAASAGQRLKLQTTYGQALLWGRGHTMPETKAAFARAGELARQVENAADRFSAYYGQWVAGLTRGDIGLAREMAELFLHEVEVQPNLPEACVGHRIFGTTCWYMGEFARAHDHLQLALNLFDRGRHHDFMHRFGQDVASQGGIFDALTLCGLGRVDEALRCAEQAGKVAEATAHVPSLAQLHYWRFLLGLVRGRPVSVLTDVNSLSRLVAEHDLRVFAGYAMFAQGWLKWRRDREAAGMTDMSEGIGYSRAQGIHMCLPMFEAALAEAEAETGKIDASLARMDQAIAETDQTGERWCPRRNPVQA
jgi:tetratricopeptide (TPR) repeat protein